MKAIITKAEMYQENTIAAKFVNDTREYPICGTLNGAEQFITKKIERIRYLKICWNCGKAYESSKHNSFACGPKCRYSIVYKLKRGIRPPVKMKFHLNAKNVSNLKEMFGYL